MNFAANPLDFLARPLRLDVSELRLPDERAVALANVINEETERERDALRKQFPPPDGKQFSTNRLSELLEPDKYVYSYADSLRWDELLTDGDCLYRITKRSGLGPEQVIDFVLKNCRPPEWRMVFWFGVAVKQMQAASSARSEVQAAQRQFSEQQRARARARYEQDKDGKQAVKAEVKEWWRAWRDNRSLYRSAAAFARAMLDKYPDHLTSQAVVEQWVRDWKASTG